MHHESKCDVDLMKELLVEKKSILSVKSAEVKLLRILRVDKVFKTRSWSGFEFNVL